MSKRKQLALLGLCTVFFVSCSLPISTSYSGLQSQLIEDYHFAVQAGFKLSSVDTQDQDLIAEVKKQFQADLQAGKKTDYQKSKDFSIHLLSGSEGNYFTSPEFTQNTLNQVLATLVVVDTSQSQVFKGEFQSPRFVFADPQQQFEVSKPTKAYLLTAENGFDIQTYKGEILPEQDLAQQSASSNETPTNTDKNAEELSETEQAEAALETTEFSPSVPPRKPFKDKISNRVNSPLAYPPAYQMHAAEAAIYPPDPYAQPPLHQTGYAQAVPGYPDEYGYQQPFGPVYMGEFEPAQSMPAYQGEFIQIYRGMSQAGPVARPVPQIVYGPLEPANDKQIQAARERRRQAFEAMKQEAEKELQYRRASRAMAILNKE